MARLNQLSLVDLPLESLHSVKSLVPLKWKDSDVRWKSLSPHVHFAKVLVEAKGGNQVQH